MQAVIYTANIIKPGIARVELAVFDNKERQGDYEITITVDSNDTVPTLERKVIKALIEVLSTPAIVFQLNGREIAFDYVEQQSLPLGNDYKHAVAQ